MTPTPTKPPRLPKGRVMFCRQASLDNIYTEALLYVRNTSGVLTQPLAVLPCKSALEAKQVVKLFTEGRGGFLHGLARIDIDGGSAEHVANLALHYASEARKLLGDRK
jgi:hypothetical protein